MQAVIASPTRPHPLPFTNTVLDPVADHPVLHTGIKTANGFSGVKVGGTPVNHVSNADTCVQHTRANGSGNVNINTSG